MSLKKVKQVKSDKGFKFLDVIVYGVIAVLVVALFITVFVTRDTSPLTGIRIFIGNEVVFEYDFENDDYNVRNSSCVEIVEDGKDTLKIKVLSDEEGYNDVVISKSGSVKIVEANCGKKDCIYTPEIKDNSGVIYCSPHRLKIVPYAFDADDGTIII